MRSIIQFAMATLCVGLVGAGLFLSLDNINRNVVLDAPGTPGRLVANSSSATAFFEMKGERLELTMLFSDEDDPDSVFRTRVFLAEGQSHSIVVGEEEDGSDGQRFFFHRTGDKVTMSLAPASARTATFVSDK